MLGAALFDAVAAVLRPSLQTRQLPWNADYLPAQLQEEIVEPFLSNHLVHAYVTSAGLQQQQPLNSVRSIEADDDNATPSPPRRRRQRDEDYEVSQEPPAQSLGELLRSAFADSSDALRGEDRKYKLCDQLKVPMYVPAQWKFLYPHLWRARASVVGAATASAEWQAAYSHFAQREQLTVTNRQKLSQLNAAVDNFAAWLGNTSTEVLTTKEQWALPFGLMALLVAGIGFTIGGFAEEQRIFREVSTAFDNGYVNYHKAYTDSITKNVSRAAESAPQTSNNNSSNNSRRPRNRAQNSQNNNYSFRPQQQQQQQHPGRGGGRGGFRGGTRGRGAGGSQQLGTGQL